jgi:hypothetical protein
MYAKVFEHYSSRAVYGRQARDRQRMKHPPRSCTFAITDGKVSRFETGRA